MGTTFRFYEYFSIFSPAAHSQGAGFLKKIKARLLGSDAGWAARRAVS
ncbi:hypothetical protein B4135_2559 [Caldibacillus debilis]|jgi:hypothetical protein|uniref:Uncharacterized protein n=1 Tax=Caldibacillus debilis TaxID=301148 RepID=A0A150LYH6_9BACI|nr:hypothetical protein B4135_2559 [Caldibacillus debilis]